MRTLRATGVIGVCLLAAACGDLATGPDVPKSAMRLGSIDMELSPHGPGRDASPYFCTGSRAVTGQPYRYVYGVQTVSFPEPELAEDGSSVIFRILSYGGGGEIAGQASCLIPNTDAAKARIERLFRTSARRGKVIGSSPNGGLTIQSEPIEGVDVYACRYGGEYPYCNYEPAWDGQKEVECPACGSGGGDPYASDGWSWGSAGGDGSEPTDPGDGTGREPCMRDATGWCTTWPIDGPQWDRIVERVNAMQDSLPECAQAKAYAQELVDQGSDRFKVWNGYDVYPDPESETGFSQRYGYNSSDSRGRILIFDSYWLFRDRTLVAHEALHNYLHRINSPLIGKENERWVREWATKCA